MTPHKVLEDMRQVQDRAGSRFALAFNGPAWERAAGIIRTAAHFDFGAAAPLTEHVEFGCELMDRGMFRLPFDAVFYTSQAAGPNALVATHCNSTPGQLHLEVWAVSPCINEASQEVFSCPLLTINVSGESWDRCRIEWASTSKSAMKVRTTGVPFEQEEWENASFKALRFIVGATTMLMSKDIEIRTEPAPAKLNAIRARKGRLPIGERRIIKVKAQHRAAYAQAADDQREGRTSPRMHLRRGHFRQLRHERFGEGRVIPVAPSIVNANEDAKPLAKSYQVEGV